MSLGRWKVKLRKSDTLFSHYIREKNNWTCQICGKYCGENNNLGKLEASHFYGRGRENTRMDEDNVVSLCFRCHNSYGHGENRPAYESFMKKKLGQEGFDLLTIRANTYKKRDDIMDLIIIENMIKELKAKETLNP